MSKSMSLEAKLESGKYIGKRMQDVIRKDGNYLLDLMDFILQKRELISLDLAERYAKAIDETVDNFLSEVQLITRNGRSELYFTKGILANEKFEDVLNTTRKGLIAKSYFDVYMKVGKNQEIRDTLQAIDKRMWDRIEQESDDNLQRATESADIDEAWNQIQPGETMDLFSQMGIDFGIVEDKPLPPIAKFLPLPELTQNTLEGYGVGELLVIADIKNDDVRLKIEYGRRKLLRGDSVLTMMNPAEICAQSYGFTIYTILKQGIKPVDIDRRGKGFKIYEKVEDIFEAFDDIESGIQNYHSLSIPHPNSTAIPIMQGLNKLGYRQSEIRMLQKIAPANNLTPHTTRRGHFVNRMRNIEDSVMCQEFTRPFIDATAYLRDENENIPRNTNF